MEQFNSTSSKLSKNFYRGVSYIAFNESKSFNLDQEFTEKDIQLF